MTPSLENVRSMNLTEKADVELRIQRWIRLIAGSFILISLLLSRLHSQYWLLFTAFVGLNLFQSALTGWCLMEDLLRKRYCR